MNTATSGRDSKAKKEIHLGANPIRIKQILAATDFSEEATLATKVAARLAKHFRCGLHVLHAGSGSLYLRRRCPNLGDAAG
jgi:nucleotide-binding universal stress UspA family protein